MFLKATIILAFTVTYCTGNVNEMIWESLQQEEDGETYHLSIHNSSEPTTASSTPSTPSTATTTTTTPPPPPPPSKSPPPPPRPSQAESKPPPTPPKGRDNNLLPAPQIDVVADQKEVDTEEYKVNSKSIGKFRQDLRIFSSVMYCRILEQVGPDENIFFSPASISHAMGMLGTGAKGNSSDQIKEGLQMSTDMPNNFIDQLFKEVTKAKFSMYQDPNVKTVMASRSFFKPKFPIKKEFVDSLQEYYHSDAEAVDFTDNVNAARRINRWVEQQTNDLIKDLVAPEHFSSLTTFVLVNALYFKASWENGFENWKVPLSFHTPTGTVPVPFLHSKREFKRLSNAKYEKIAIPYKGGKTFFFIVMPKTDEAMKEFEEEESLKDFYKTMKHRVTKLWKPETITLYMPRFTTEMSLDVKKILPTMGVSDVFSSTDANLGGISNQFLYVSEFLHKARITVNKDGTEAAAATAVIGVARSLNEIVKINRPYIFGIFEIEGDILFMGKMVNPSGK